MTKTYNNYESLLTFTRASKGHALRPVSYGSEEVTNGTFDSDLSGWNIVNDDASNTVTYDSGAVDFVGDGSVSLSMNQDNVFTVGVLYQLTIDVTVNAGNVGGIKIQYAGLDSSIGVVTESGSYTFNFVPNSTKLEIYRRTGGQATNVTIDNISVKEVTFDESDGTLTLFEHPNNVPRVEYDADGNRLGLLVEESRTNLDTASDFFTGGGGVTATKNHTAPDKTLSASTISYSGGLTPYLNATSIAFTSGTTYTFSFFLKRGTGTQNVQTLLYGAAFNSGGANCVVVYDLDAETSTVASGSFTAHSVTKIGDGWYRCSCSSTATASVSQSQQIYRAGAADDGNYDYIWGKQVEAGSFPTSYIKTTGSTATRSSELADVSVDTFGYNNSNEGTFVIHAKNLSYNPNGTDYPFLVRFDNDTNSNDRLGIFLSEASGNLVAEIKRNNVTQMSPVFKTATGGAVNEITVAFAFAENDFAVSDDGDSVITDTAGTLVPGKPIAKIGLGQAFNSVHMNVHITSFKYYPRRLTNAQLEELSS